MLARSEGKTHPLAWVEVWESHTPYEWMLQEVLAVVEPWGERRADIRGAVHALAVCGSMATIEHPEDAINSLQNYLKVHEKDSSGSMLTPEQAAKMIPRR